MIVYRTTSKQIISYSDDQYPSFGGNSATADIVLTSKQKDKLNEGYTAFYRNGAVEFETSPHVAKKELCDKIKKARDFDEIKDVVLELLK